MTRLFFYVAIAFATSFAAVLWAARGFPMHWSGPVNSLQPTVTSTFGDQSARDDERKRQESGPAAQKDAPQGDGRSFGPNEKYMVEGREKQRESAIRALDMPWGSRCSGDDRKQFISGLNFSAPCLKSDGFRHGAEKLIATVVKNERVTGKGCNG